MAEQSLVSQQGFEPSVSTKQINPQGSINASDIQSAYNRKKDVANQLLSLSTTFVQGVGSKLEYDRAVDLAERKVDKENIHSAEILGREMAASNKEWNSSTARDIILKSIKFRKDNPKLLKQMEHGFHLKQGEVSLSTWNSKIKDNSEGAVESKAREWLQNRQLGVPTVVTDLRGEQITQRVPFDKDFPTFLGEWIEDTRIRDLEYLLTKNPYIKHVLAKQGNRINYDSVYSEGAKWFKKYKVTEKNVKADELLRNQYPLRRLTIQEWVGSSRKKFREATGETRDEADLRILDIYRGYLLEEAALGGDPNNLNPHNGLYTTIDHFLKDSPKDGVSLLVATGTKDKAKELLTLLDKVRDAAWNVQKNKTKNQNAETLLLKQQKGSRLVRGFLQEGISAKGSNQISKIIENLGEEINKPSSPLYDGSTMTGRMTVTSLQKELQALMKEKIAVERTKQPLGSDQEKEKVETLQMMHKINEEFTNDSIFATKSYENKKLQIENVIQKLKDLEDGFINKEEVGYEWKGYLEFKKKFTDSKNVLYKLKRDLQNAEIDKLDDSKLEKRKTVNLKKIQEQTAHSNKRRSLTETLINNHLDTFLQTGSTTEVDEINKILAYTMTVLSANSDNTDTISTTSPLRNGTQISKIRQKIRTIKTQRKNKIEADKGKPVQSNLTTYESLNRKIDSLQNISRDKLFDENGNPIKEIKNINNDIYTAYESRQLSDSHFTRLNSLMDGIQDNSLQVLDEQYGTKSTFDSAETSLRLLVTGSADQGIDTILDGDSLNIFHTLNTHLHNFDQTLKRKWPSIFGVGASPRNHPIRRAVLEGYVKNMSGKTSGGDLKELYRIDAVSSDNEPIFNDKEKEIFNYMLSEGTQTDLWKKIKFLNISGTGEISNITGNTGNTGNTGTNTSTTNINKTIQNQTKVELRDRNAKWFGKVGDNIDEFLQIGN